MAAKPSAEVCALEAAWRDALLAKDEPALRRILHPRFELVAMRAAGARTVGVDEWMEKLATMDLAAVEMRVVSEITLPHTIVATVDACWKVRYRGQCIDERVFLTDVWVREDDRWQVLRRHSSLVPPGIEVD